MRRWSSSWARHPDRGRLGLADQRQLVRAWIEDELGLETRRRLASGNPALDRDAEVAVLRAVENAIWGLGRVQKLLDLPDVEDIHIVGAERPLLRLRDGTVAPAREPVADSDADLIAQLQYVAAHHGGAERAFSPAQPLLNMQLPDGSRLAAMRDVVPHPTVTIRRHRLVDVTLADLAGLRHAVARAWSRFLPRWSRPGAASWSPGCPRRARRPCCARWPAKIPPRRAGGDPGNRVRARPAPAARAAPPLLAGDGVPPGLDRGRPGHRTHAPARSPCLTCCTRPCACRSPG